MKLPTWRKVRLSIVREPFAETGLAIEPVQVKHGKDVANLLRAVIGEDPREQFFAVYVDASHKPIGVHLVSLGISSACPVDPKSIFGPAMMLSAEALVICHNHPSGDPTPSQADREVTNRMKEVGELVGIEVLDHLVIGATRFYSFASECFYPWGQ